MIAAIIAVLRLLNLIVVDLAVSPVDSAWERMERLAVVVFVSLPLGAKIGITFAVGLLAWPIVFAGWDRLDGLGRRRRSLGRGLLYSVAGFGLMAIGAVGLWGVG